MSEIVEKKTATTKQEVKNEVPVEVQVVQAKAAAEYALTPAGQYTNQFNAIQRKAMMLSSSTIVPTSYQGNVGNCVIALEMAERMGAVPLMIMQNLYVVNGTPSFSSKFLIATINASKRFSPLRYEFKGQEGTQTWGCRCVAYEAHDKERKEPLEGDWVTMDMASKEGWSKKQGSKWLTMPNQMLRYRAAAFWQRVYCPEISMGLLTTEEAEDIQTVEYVDVTTQQGAIEKTQDAKSRADAAIAQATGKASENVDKETGEILKDKKK